MSDLVVYDTEANDKDPRHGQITQFGAIRADMDLNELEELNLRVRRLPWVVPMPEALRVTGMDPRDLEGPGTVSEYEASGQIEKFLVPGYGVQRVNLTFNGIRFDDEIIRTMLFRNLRNPWFSSGKLTTKVDLLNLVQLVHSIDPEAVVVPRDEDDKLKWKLDRLCPANGIAIDAHDALGDARATLALARLIKERAPWAWAIALDCGLASKVESLLEGAVKTGRPIYLFTHFGAPEIIPCAVLGTDRKKKWIMADLRCEQRPTEPGEIAEALFTRGTPFPVIRSNSGPLIVDAAIAAKMDKTIDPSGIAAKAMEIKLSKGLRDKAVEALNSCAYESTDAVATSESRIYAGFIPERDKPSMTKFHRSTWEERTGIQFSDDRLRDFAARIFVDAVRAGEFSVSNERLAEFEAACAEAISRPYAGDEVKWGTLRKALASGADDHWVQWATEAFGELPSLEASGSSNEDAAPAQMSMSF